MAPSSGNCGKNSPRLIDYLVFVGRKNPGRNGPAIAPPELLRVYPPQNHADFPLPNDIVYFCQPEGCYNTSSRSFILDPRHSGGRLPQNIKMEFFTFMLTDKESNTVRFGICLNFLRPIGRKKSSYTADVTRRRITSFKSALHYPHSETKITKLNNRANSLNSGSSSESSDYSGCQNIDKSDRPYTHTLTSICLVSRYQFFKKFENCLRFLYVLIQKLHEGCKPRLFGRQTVWSVLVGAVESPELLTVRKCVEEIDTWVLRLLSTPAPVAGRTAIHVYLQPPEFAPPMVFALPDKERFSLVDYSLYLPLQLLGVEKFLKVFFTLLLEQKVVLESSHHDRVATCVLAFTALCYPLQYLFTVIPLLPSSLKGAEQLLQAPSPYIIGLPRSFRDSRLSFHLPKDVLLVDLDTQELYGQGAQDPVSRLPATEEKALISFLNKVEVGLRGLKDEAVPKKEEKGSTDSSSLSELYSFDLLAHNLDEESLNLAIRVAMVHFFKSPNILGGLEEYTRVVRIYPRPVVAFQYERFMKSRPEASPFTVVFAKTQIANGQIVRLFASLCLVHSFNDPAVEYFAEWSLMPDNLAYQRVESVTDYLMESGKKDRWSNETLSIIPFQLWTERFDRGVLRPVVEILSSSSSAPVSYDKFALDWSAGKQLTIKPSPSVSPSSTSGACEIGITSDSDTPTDVSASNGDSHVNTEAERDSELESGKPTRSKIVETISKIAQGEEGLEKNKSHLPEVGEPRRGGGEIFSSVAFSIAEQVECMQFGKELPSNLRAYYSPPTSFVIPDQMPQSDLSTVSPSHQASPQGGHLLNEVAQRLLSTASTTSGVFPSNTSETSENLRFFNPNLATLRMSGLEDSFTSRRPSSQMSQSSQPRNLKSTLSAIMDGWVSDAAKSTTDALDPAARKQRAKMEIAENQRFIADCITTIRRGSQPGVFSRRRLLKLLELEMYRNFVLALTNGNTGHPVPPDQSHIADVHLDSWDQYKAYAWLFNQLSSGIRHSCCPLTSTFLDSRGDVVSATGLAQAFRDLFASQADRERLVHGGVCSAFNLLEMAHTHHYILPKRRNVTSQASITSERRLQTSLAASLPSSPKHTVLGLASPRSESVAQSNGDVQNNNSLTLTTPRAPASCSGGENLQHQYLQQHQHEHQSSQFSFRDMPDLVELSQKLQTRLAEAFKSSLANQSPDSGEGREVRSQMGTHLSYEAAIRLSQRLMASQRMSIAYQKPTRSRDRRSRLFLPSSHTLDDESELTPADWVRHSRRRGVSSDSRESLSPEVVNRSFTRRRHFNVINMHNPASSQQFSLAQRQQKCVDEEESRLANCSGISMDMVEDAVLLSPFKSAVSLGYRYRHGRLYQVAAHVSPTVGTPPPCISVPALRISLSDQRSKQAARKTSTNSMSESRKEENSEEVRDEEVELKPAEVRSKIGQTYLFEEVMVNSTDSKLWTNMQFWEDLFFDTVAQERELLGMDFGPASLLEHYAQLGAIDRKHLELEEDALLAGVMHNLIAFMVMARITPDLIRRKIRRLIAKSHTGLHYTQKISQLLDCLEWLKGNDIDLLPIASRQSPPATFTVWNKDNVFTLEIYAEFVFVRVPHGPVICRWWFDQIINVTCSPQRSTVIFQTNLNKKRGLFLFNSDDTHLLFNTIASAMGRARSRSQQVKIIEKLGGRVNVIDAKTGEAGEIEINSNGFQLFFGKRSHLFPLDQVKRCAVTAEDSFSIVVGGYDHSEVVWDLKTDLAAILLNQFDRLINVAIANNPINLRGDFATPMSSRSRKSSTSNLEAFDR